jgi:hypothetical protein
MPKGHHDSTQKGRPAPKPPDEPCQCRYESTPRWWRIVEGIGVAAVVVYAVITWGMWRDSHDNFFIDERAWLSVPARTAFPLTGTFVPALTQIVNSGETPARAVEVDVVATVLNKGEEPALGDFSVGHPHNHAYTGAVFLGAPIPMTAPVVHYGPAMVESIVPEDALRPEIANGKRYIFFYGRITCYDVFGIQHWTQFCTGSGPLFLTA